MEAINIRFKKLREDCKKTQTEWGEILGIKTSGVSDIENGRRKVTEKHLIMLGNWKEFNINLEWLRTGEGEMIIHRTKDQVITDFLADIIMEEETFKKRLIEVLAELDTKDWETLEKLATTLANKKG